MCTLLDLHLNNRVIKQEGETKKAETGEKKTLGNILPHRPFVSWRLAGNVFPEGTDYKKEGQMPRGIISLSAYHIHGP